MTHIRQHTYTHTHQHNYLVLLMNSASHGGSVYAGWRSAMLLKSRSHLRGKRKMERKGGKKATLWFTLRVLNVKDQGSSFCVLNVVKESDSKRGRGVGETKTMKTVVWRDKAKETCCSLFAFLCSSPILCFFFSILKGRIGRGGIKYG